jgi:hypothetical protein
MSADGGDNARIIELQTRELAGCLTYAAFANALALQTFRFTTVERTD